MEMVIDSLKQEQKSLSLIIHANDKNTIKDKSSK